MQCAEDALPMQVSKTPRRILLADDNIDAAQTLRLLLELSGHEVHTVHNGLAAVEAFSTFRPEIVLLDYRYARTQRL
jgi:CheY-like chemotaxis protein